MSYAIGYFVYGFDLTECRGSGEASFEEALLEASQKNPSEFDLDAPVASNELLDCLKESGVLWSAYSGSGDMPLAFGVKVGSIDECSPMSFQSLLKRAEITDEHREKYAALLKKYPTLTQIMQERMLEPELRLIWGSS